MATTVIEGVEELLAEAISALVDAPDNPFIVIGGWCPYLRNSSEIRHPGTLDVDLLFQKGHTKGALKGPIEALLNGGFVPSAKHPFQLLREKRIGNERLIYNVDLLHPMMNDFGNGMFVDHFDLDIPLDDEERRVKKMQSIVQPNSVVLFDENLYTRFTRSGVEFNLVDFTGMFITKMDSCQKAKRERDSLDIYLGFKSDSINFRKVESICSSNDRIAKSLRKFEMFLTENLDFDENVAKFTDIGTTSPSKYILEALSQARQRKPPNAGSLE